MLCGTACLAIKKQYIYKMSVVGSANVKVDKFNDMEK